MARLSEPDGRKIGGLKNTRKQNAIMDGRRERPTDRLERPSVLFLFHGRRIEGRRSKLDGWHLAVAVELEKRQVIAFTARSLVVTLKSHQDLEGLLTRFAHFKAYYLMPAVWDESMPQPKFLEQVPVLKRRLTAMDTCDVTRSDIGWMAVEQSKERG